MQVVKDKIGERQQEMAKHNLEERKQSWKQGREVVDAKTLMYLEITVRGVIEMRARLSRLHA